MGILFLFYTIAATNEVVYIGQDLPDEYAHSEYTYSLKGAYAKAKANAAQVIPELIEIASERHCKENKTTLQEFVFGLIQDYFGIDPYETINQIQCSKVLVLNSDTTDFDVLGIAVLDRINQAEANLRIGYAIMTDEEYRPY